MTQLNVFQLNVLNITIGFVELLIVILFLN